MGMFDTFKTENTFECPHCHKTMIFSNGIQTKKFINTLMEFNPGDYIDDIDIDKFIVTEYDYCPHCNKKIPIFFAFHHQIYVETFISEETAKRASKNFNVYRAYRYQYKQKEFFQNLSSDIENKLKSILEVHNHQDRIPSPLFNILYRRISDILDYSIIKTLENLLRYLMKQKNQKK